jgi:uncharacterized protein (TIGR02444 family)
MSTVEGFWDFSVRTYRSKGVSDACLALQNKRGADVNMLLYCCWVAIVYGEFDDDLFQSALRFSRSWARHVVRPLREVRTWMKLEDCRSEPVFAESRKQLRANVKTIELEAEKLQQTSLESLVVVSAAQHLAVSDLLGYAAANLQQYCRAEAIGIAGESVDQLSVIVSAAITSATREAAVASLT